MTLDTVRGAETEKLRQYRMPENPCFGSLSRVPAYRLRQIMNHLLLNGYLETTDGSYSVVKLTERSEDVLCGAETVTMKRAKEPERRPAKTREEKKKKAVLASGLREGDEPMFEKLRSLRAAIAREEKVPPYIVFSDKTLVHMCIVRPSDKAEMLTVTGVGEFKYQKYGERFLECVREAGKWNSTS